MANLKISLILSFILVALPSCASTREKKLSDHFDGKKYFNPTLVGKFYPGFSDVFRMLREPKIPWPKTAENKAVPRLNEDLGRDGVGITFVNHATFLIQLPGLTILTDPVWSKRVSPLSWAGPKRIREPGVKIEDLPKVDLILISHNHYDHFDKETLRQLNKRFAPKVMVPVGDKELAESIGLKDVTELDWWQDVVVGENVRITFAPTQHSSARTPFDKDESLWGSYLIQSGKRSIYFGGDAGYSSHYSEIKKRLGSPDIALLGIGAYLPRWFMQPLHMDPTEAVVAHKDLGAKLSIAMHYGTFQLSAEGFDQPLVDLQKALTKEKIPPGSFISLLEGETRVF